VEATHAESLCVELAEQRKHDFMSIQTLSGVTLNRECSESSQACQTNNDCVDGIADVCVQRKTFPSGTLVSLDYRPEHKFQLYVDDLTSFYGGMVVIIGSQVAVCKGTATRCTSNQDCPDSTCLAPFRATIALIGTMFCVNDETPIDETVACDTDCPLCVGRLTFEPPCDVFDEGACTLAGHTWDNAVCTCNEFGRIIHQGTYVVPETLHSWSTNRCCDGKIQPNCLPDESRCVFEDEERSPLPQEVHFTSQRPENAYVACRTCPSLQLEGPAKDSSWDTYCVNGCNGTKAYHRPSYKTTTPAATKSHLANLCDFLPCEHVFWGITKASSEGWSPQACVDYGYLDSGSGRCEGEWTASGTCEDYCSTLKVCLEDDSVCSHSSEGCTCMGNFRCNEGILHLRADTFRKRLLASGLPVTAECEEAYEWQEGQYPQMAFCEGVEDAASEMECQKEQGSWKPCTTLPRPNGKETFVKRCLT